MLHEQIAKSMAHDKNKFDYSSMARHLTFNSQAYLSMNPDWVKMVKPICSIYVFECSHPKNSPARCRSRTITNLRAIAKRLSNKSVMRLQ